VSSSSSRRGRAVGTSLHDDDSRHGTEA